MQTRWVKRLPAIRRLQFKGSFNWSTSNNFAARETQCDVLVFLNNDTGVISEGWCTEIVSQAMRPDVSAVGTRLLYSDGTIQHAGTALRGTAGGPEHEGVGENVANGGYLGRSRLQRGVAAVTGACLATRKQVFELVGGFDDVHLKIVHNDTDYCMKVRAAGLQVLYTLFATMYHCESKSRGIAHLSEQKARETQEASIFKRRWRSQMDDPFYNPHFDRHGRPFQILRAPKSKPIVP